MSGQVVRRVPRGESDRWVGVTEKPPTQSKVVSGHLKRKLTVGDSGLTLAQIDFAAANAPELTAEQIVVLRRILRPC
jgi:hypothetical protein